MKRSLRKKNLKKGKQLQAGGFITNPTYRQIIQPHLKWLLDKRDTAARMDRVGINAAIILFSAIYLEGFLEEVLSSFVGHYTNPVTRGKSERLLRIEMLSSLDNYKKTFDDFGLTLNGFLKSSDIEDLDYVFKFRNCLAHGQRDSYLTLHEGDWIPKKIVGSHYHDIETFLVKRKVIKRAKGSTQPNINFILFSDATADWTCGRVKALCIEILKDVSFTRQLQEFHLKQTAESVKALS